MKISQEVRDYAAKLEKGEIIEIQLLDETITLDATNLTINNQEAVKGMAEKSAEFKATGSKIYHAVK